MLAKNQLKQRAVASLKHYLTMHKHSNETRLQHPSGTTVVLVGSQHASATHGQQTSAIVQAVQPTRVLLELDEARFSQVDMRLRFMLHADTASLLDLTAAKSGQSLSQRLLPDALLWAQHMQQFALMRNEGVPLLLGSLYGGDFLQAALAASAMQPQQAALVLADQPQAVTLARFHALTDTFGALRRLLELFVGTAHAEAYQEQQWQIGLSTAAAAHHATLNSSQGSSAGLLAGLQQLQRICTAAAQLAAGRMFHLCLEWWSMALTSRARWYAEQIHPVFLLVGNPELQQKLAARGCEGVAEAAAAAGRLLELAAATPASHSHNNQCYYSNSHSSSYSSAGGMPAVEDLLAIRRFVGSLESMMWSTSAPAAAAAEATAGASDNTTSATSSRLSSSSSSSNGRGSSQIMHWLEQEDAGNGSASGLSELMPLRPWWVTLRETFSSKLAAAAGVDGGSSNSSSTSLGGAGLASALQHHQHANVTAAAAYDQAVMAERNSILAAALWQHAEAAAAEKAAQAAHGTSLQSQDAAAVVAVVGYNHVPGIVQLWRQMQEQPAQAVAAADTTNSSGGSRVLGASACASSSSSQDMFLPWQVTLTDAAAGALELAAAGGAGLMYVAAVNRWAPSAAAKAARAQATSAGSGGSSGFARMAAKLGGGGPGMRRLGLLLLPVAVALLPLQQDAKRLQEAGRLLTKVAAANDVILTQEVKQLAADRGSRQQANPGTLGTSSLMQLALQAGASL